MNKPAALQRQEGGDHYSKLVIQPMEFSMANNWDACAHTILKYVTRHADKNGRQDLLKAQHCIAMRYELWHSGHQVAEAISASTYCEKNQLGPQESAVIIHLASWVQTNHPDAKQYLEWALERLISTTYDLSQDQLAFSTDS